MRRVRCNYTRGLSGRHQLTEVSSLRATQCCVRSITIFPNHTHSLQSSSLIMSNFRHFSESAKVESANPYGSPMKDILRSDPMITTSHSETLMLNHDSDDNHENTPRSLWIDNEDTAQQWLSDFLQSERRWIEDEGMGCIFGIDTEFKHLNEKFSTFNNSDLYLVSIWTDHPDYAHLNSVWDLTPKSSLSLSSDQTTNIRDVLLSDYLSRFLSSEHALKVFHYYSIDHSVLQTAMMKLNQNTQHNHHSDPSLYSLNGFYADTAHMARLYNAGLPFNGLSELCRYFGTQSSKPMNFKQTLKSFQGKSIEKDPQSWHAYAENDARCTAELFAELRERLESVSHWKNPSYDLWYHYDTVWRDLAQSLADLECRGLAMDDAHLHSSFKKGFEERREHLTVFREWAVKQHEDAGVINLSSNPQLAHFFFGDPRNEGERMVVRVPIIRDNHHGGCEEESSESADQSDEGKKKPSKPRKKYREAIVPKLGFRPQKRTKTGSRPAFDAEVLQSLIDHGVTEHYIGKTVNERDEAIRALKSLQRAKTVATQMTTFISPLIDHCQSYNSAGSSGSQSSLKLHPCLNLNTETGRLSCRRPNLQNQPASCDPYQIRKSYVASSEDRTLIVADYSQLEIRVLAMLSQCDSMIDALNAGGDYHSRTAVKMFDYIQQSIDEGKVAIDKDGTNDEIPLVKQVFNKERHIGKTINFGIAYGMGAGKMARDLGIDKRTALERLRQWYSDKPEVRIWQFEQMYEAMANGHTHTLTGRRRQLMDPIQMFGDSHTLNLWLSYLDSKRKRKEFEIEVSKDWNRFRKHHRLTDVLLNTSELSAVLRRAINTPIQGTAADIVAQAMVRIQRNPELHRLDFGMVLQIHDELILDGPKRNVEKAVEIVQECMQQPWSVVDQSVFQCPFSVPFSVDIKHDRSWFHAK